MPWWQWRREAEEAAAKQQEAEAAMAAIFAPSHAAVKKASSTDSSILRLSGVRLFKEGEEEAKRGELAAVSGPVAVATQAKMAEKVNIGAGISSNRSEETKETPSWRSLPPSPILGYTLREEGLVDDLVNPPKTLSARDVKSLIVELSSIEQQAKYSVDTQFPQQVHNKGRRSMELVISPCLFMSGLYLMLWKAPRLYFGASPRGSIVFTRALALMRWYLPEVEKERLARNNRRLFQATNARVTLSFLTGCGLTMIAVATRPPLDVVDVGPDVEVGKQSVGLQQHSEAALRWLWFVYYHHPVYRSLAKGVRPPILQGGDPRC
ncbi:hypothetical protein DQ04_00831060 [Trypanosoma grayi]|uniref:hypothetical protein n=1 Tax=Trypanosoma grayi TaxID=71804 RepID=UPI0004F4BAC6|nr:hypothetical protein DQ04_00831060 [Trypanosoma grayi]KEG13709.1 hypothetical protein DQ04_00831060 [Trypanosoma grayi]